MIRKDKGEYVCTCDECGDKNYGGTLEFHDFVQQLKEDGWRIRKDEDEWQHFCPECES